MNLTTCWLMMDYTRLSWNIIYYVAERLLRRLFHQWLLYPLSLEAQYLEWFPTNSAGEFSCTTDALFYTFTIDAQKWINLFKKTMHDYWYNNWKYFWSNATFHAFLVVIFDLLDDHAYVQSHSLTDYFLFDLWVNRINHKSQSLIEALIGQKIIGF